MSDVREEIRSYLTVDKPDYRQAAAKLGPDSIPFLIEFISGNDPNLARRSASLVSFIKDNRSIKALEMGIKSSDPAVRVAVARGLQRLPEDVGNKFSEMLLKDEDVGVRKATLKSISISRWKISASKFQEMANKDSNRYIRALAGKILSESKRNIERK